MRPQAGEAILLRRESHQAAGLNDGSTIRVHKLTVLAKGEIVRRLGALTEPDREALLSLPWRAFDGDPGRTRHA